MKTLYGKFNDNGLLEIVEIVEKKVFVKTENGEYVERIVTIDEQIGQYEQKGWKPVEEPNFTDIHFEEFETIVDIPFDAGDKIKFNYEKKLDKTKIDYKILELKQQLADSDYKIVKCYEASMLSNDLPYDIETLHTERQAIRDEINRLEDLLK
jgi:hypothetical protein